MIEQTWLVHFLFACLIMGLGIGIDVAIATFMRAPYMRDKKIAARWVMGVSATHTLFPMIGYLFTYFSLQALPVITPLVGVAAFVLILWFLVDEFKGLAESDHESNHACIGFALVLAVSWDALWSGPAKSAQVEDWSEWMIWLSFLLVGIVVMAFCLGSLHLARKICALSNLGGNITNPKMLNISRWVQYSVINYFGMLALVRYTFSSDVNWLYILSASFILMWLVMRAYTYKTVFFRKAYS